MPLKTIPQNLTWISSQLSLFFHSFSPQLLDHPTTSTMGKIARHFCPLSRPVPTDHMELFVETPKV